jgi:1,4-alpha-glucan branching enzyme
MNPLIRNESQEPADTIVKHEIAVAASGIRKRYLIGRNACAVTFRLAAADVPGAKRVVLVGDFNNWDARAHPMRKRKNGDYGRCLRLEAGRHYQYRYIVDGIPAADDTVTEKTVESPHSNGGNSIVVV